MTRPNHFPRLQAQPPSAGGSGLAEAPEHRHVDDPVVVFAGQLRRHLKIVPLIELDRPVIFKVYVQAHNRKTFPTPAGFGPVRWDVVA